MNNKENKQIENILKKSSEEIEMKPFTERWEDIEDKLEFNRGEKIVAKEQVPVLAMSSNSFEGKKPIINKKKILVLSICLFFIILLAIIIPLSFRKTEPVYFGPSDLIQVTVNEDTFFEEIKKSKIDVVNIDGYQCEDYTLLKTDIGEVQGGSFVINDEENFAVAHITFYSASVIVPDNDYIDAEKYTIAKTEISYIMLEQNTEIIEYKALARHKTVTYELGYMSLSDNVIVFFEKFFRNE